LKRASAFGMFSRISRSSPSRSRMPIDAAASCSLMQSMSAYFIAGGIRSLCRPLAFVITSTLVQMPRSCTRFMSRAIFVPNSSSGSSSDFKSST